MPGSLSHPHRRTRRVRETVLAPALEILIRTEGLYACLVLRVVECGPCSFGQSRFIEEYGDDSILASRCGFIAGRWLYREMPGSLLPASQTSAHQQVLRYFIVCCIGASVKARENPSAIHRRRGSHAATAGDSGSRQSDWRPVPFHRLAAIRHRRHVVHHPGFNSPIALPAGVVNILGRSVVV